MAVFNKTLFTKTDGRQDLARELYSADPCRGYELQRANFWSASFTAEAPRAHFIGTQISVELIYRMWEAAHERCLIEWRQMLVSMKLFSPHDIVISILPKGKLRPKPAQVAKPGTLSHLLHSREFLVVLVVRWPQEMPAKSMWERILTALGASSDWLDHQRLPSPHRNRLIPWAKGRISRRNQAHLSWALIPPPPLSLWDSVHKSLTRKDLTGPSSLLPRLYSSLQLKGHTPQAGIENKEARRGPSQLNQSPGSPKHWG